MKDETTLVSIGLVKDDLMVNYIVEPAAIAPVLAIVVKTTLLNVVYCEAVHYVEEKTLFTVASQLSLFAAATSIEISLGIVISIDPPCGI